MLIWVGVFVSHIRSNTSLDNTSLSKRIPITGGSFTEPDAHAYPRGDIAYVRVGVAFHWS